MDLLKLWQMVVSVVKDFWPNKKQMYVATLVGNSRYTTSILIYAENFRKLSYRNNFCLFKFVKYNLIDLAISASAK